MIDVEKRKELLGEFYIDITKEKKKQLYVDVINKFINSDEKFLPILHIAKSSNTYLKNFLKANPNLILLDLKVFILDCNTKLKDGETYFMNDVAIVYDNDIKRKKIFLKRGHYGSYNEMHVNLGISTLRALYEMFVYNVVSYKFLIRHKKEIYKKYNEIINEDCLYVTKDNNYIFLRYNKSNEKYNLFSNKMYLNVTRYLSDLSFYTERICFNTFNSISYLFDGLNNCKKITDKKEIEILLREHFDDKISELVKRCENSLSKLNELTFFNS